MITGARVAETGHSITPGNYDKMVFSPQQSEVRSKMVAVVVSQKTKISQLELNPLAGNFSLLPQKHKTVLGLVGFGVTTSM